MALAPVVAMALVLLAAAPATPAAEPPPLPSRPALEPPPLPPPPPAKPSAKARRRPPRPCPFLAADAKPIIKVTGSNQRAPYALYPLGFSKQGRFAWLETLQGFDDDRHTWILHVVNLDDDRAVVEREFSVSKAGVPAMCDADAATITRLLERQQITFGTPPVLAPADDPKAPTVEVVAGRRDEENAKTPYRVLLRSPEGSKQVGVLWHVEAESGDYPRAKPVIVGLLRSPFEPRAAVVARQKVISTEAFEVTEVTVMGSRLDRGWRKEAP